MAPFMTTGVMFARVESISAPDVTADPPDRRAELAAAAFEIIAERGLPGLSLRALARRVGATTGLVTHYYLDRAELVDAALQHARSLMVERFEALPPSTPLIDVLAGILPIDDEATTSWRVWLSVRAGALADPDLADFHRHMYDEWGDELRRRLRPRLADANDGPPLDWAVDHMMAVIDGIALRATLDRDAWPADRQRSHVATAVTTLAESRSLSPEAP